MHGDEAASARQFHALAKLLDSLVAPLGAAETPDAVRLSASVALNGNASFKAAWIAERRTPVPPRTVVSSTELSLHRTWARSAPLPAGRVALARPAAAAARMLTPP